MKGNFPTGKFQAIQTPFYYYDMDLLKITGSKQVPGKIKGKVKTEYTYEFKD